MIAYEPFNRFNLVLFEPEAWCDFSSNLRANDRVIFGPAFADAFSLAG